MNLKSILFVPALRPDLFRKAIDGNASAICVDLEDSIAPDKKSEARSNLEDKFTLPTSSDKSLMVRVNCEPELLSHDLLSIRKDVDFIMLPKTGSVDQINTLARSLESRFDQFGPDIICLIESGSDLDRLRQNPEPLSERVKAMALGTEDLATDFAVSSDAPIIRHCFYELAVLCRRWELQLLGYPGSIAEFRDLNAFEESVGTGADAGASGGFCIHPAQVDILNRVFTPAAFAVEHAKRVVEAFETALSKGEGVCSVDGKMIDRPVYLSAQTILSRAR